MEPAFRNAKRGQPWFSPVYFKKESEPYMTIAIRSGSDTGPVTIADVNLKFIWDVVWRIKIGEKGKAYVVDGNGFLVSLRRFDAIYEINHGTAQVIEPAPKNFTKAAF